MISISSVQIGKRESYYVSKVLKSGWLSSGPMVKKFEAAFAKWAGTKNAVAVSSGTAALECAVWACKVKGEIIMPSGTIISCPIAAIRAGATPVFCDIQDDKPVIDEKSFGECITPETDAVMRAHMFGFESGPEPKIIKAYCDIEDRSQYWSRPTKPPLDVAVYSLYANKLITSGEGGILVTNSDEIADRARDYRNLCHSDIRFLHKAIGYNFRMSDLQAAVALGQLERIDEFTEKKRQVRDWYIKYLPEDCLNIRFVSKDVDVPWMNLVEICAKDMTGPYVAAHLMDKGIEARRFFCPMSGQLYLPDSFRKRHISKPVNAERAWYHQIYLPSGVNLTEREVKKVCSTLMRIIIT